MPQGYPMVEHAVFPNGACFAYDNTGAVIDGEMGAKMGARMNINASPAMCYFGHHARYQWHIE